MATIVKRAVEYGLHHRPRPPVHVIGIDEVSRRKGQVYLTVAYDLERRVLLWVGEDRSEEAVKKFLTGEMGRRRCHTLQVVCMDIWAPYASLVRQHAPNAQILFDRFNAILKQLREERGPNRSGLIERTHLSANAFRLGLCAGRCISFIPPLFSVATAVEPLTNSALHCGEAERFTLNGRGHAAIGESASGARPAERRFSREYWPFSRQCAPLR